jgi:citrate lyase subunit beta/citryl-CoA lyase
MRRSLLFVPGNNPAIVQTADVFGADGVIFDLEDAVSVDEKDAARLLLSRFLALPLVKNHEVIIRINGLDSPFFDADLDRIVVEKLDSLMVPKACVRDLKIIAKRLSELETSRQLKKTIALIPIIESAASLLEVEAIATLPRVTALLFGAEDFSNDMEIKRTRLGDEISYPRARVAVACKAAGIDAIDTPFTDTADTEGLKADIAKAKSFGFVGKACIHPNQIDVINAGFAPTLEEIRQAKRIVIAFRAAELEHTGVFTLDGKMIDKPIVERAQKLLKKATLCGMKVDLHD